RTHAPTVPRGPPSGPLPLRVRTPRLHRRPPGLARPATQHPDDHSVVRPGCGHVAAHRPHLHHRTAVRTALRALPADHRAALARGFSTHALLSALAPPLPRRARSGLAAQRHLESG